MHSHHMKTSILLLAAGNSSRLGRPKQLLRLPSGKTLLEHTLHEAQQSRAWKVEVVLGAYSAEMLPLLAAHTQAPILHREWEKGMGSSIKAGLAHILQNPPQALIISVCDQPYIHHTLFDALMARLPHAPTQLLASQYESGALGVPAIFGEKWFEALASLPDGAGAKALLQKAQAGHVPFPKGDIDIDTEEDWKNV
jgi:molybdenum cofactor cytidylyltransferase